mgnify:CR=1 FL=1
MLQTCMLRSTSPPGHCDKAASGYHSFPENGNLYSAEYCKRHPSHPSAQGRAFPHASLSHRLDPPRTPTSMRRHFTRANLTGGKPGLPEHPARIFSCCETPTDCRSTGVSRYFHHPVGLNTSLLPDANQQTPFLAKLKGPMKGANDDAEE